MIILDRELSQCLQGFWPISDCVLLVMIQTAIIQVYAPTAAADEKEIDQFCDDLDRVHRSCKSQQVTIIQEDINAKVGAERVENTVGPHGLGEK